MAVLKRQRELWLILLEKEEAQRRMVKIAYTDVDAKCIMTVPSVGLQTAVRLLAHISGNIARFKNSRQFAK